MVFRSVSEAQTPPLSPPPPPPPPPMVSAASFYLRPQTTPSMPRFPLASSLRWNTNQYQPNFRPSYSGLNPVLRFGSSQNCEDYLSSALLRLGSSPNRDEEDRDAFSGSDRSDNDTSNESDLEPAENEGNESDGKLCLRLPVKTKESGDADEDGGDQEDEDEGAEAEFSFEEPFVKTWNLRPRKPPTKPPNPGGGGGSGSRSCPAAKKLRPAPRARPRPRAEEKAAAPAPGGAAPSVQKRPVISVSLGKEEIEEDFLKMTGAKPSKKPQKRPRAVQKQLDMCFPGLWLNAVTPETYKIPDPPLKG